MCWIIDGVCTVHICYFSNQTNKQPLIGLWSSRSLNQIFESTAAVGDFFFFMSVTYLKTWSEQKTEAQRKHRGKRTRAGKPRSGKHTHLWEQWDQLQQLHHCRTWNTIKITEWLSSPVCDNCLQRHHTLGWDDCYSEVKVENKNPVFYSSTYVTTITLQSPFCQCHINKHTGRTLIRNHWPSSWRTICSVHWTTAWNLTGCWPHVMI